MAKRLATAALLAAATQGARMSVGEHNAAYEERMDKYEKDREKGLMDRIRNEKRRQTQREIQRITDHVKDLKGMERMLTHSLTPMQQLPTVLRKGDIALLNHLAMSTTALSPRAKEQIDNLAIDGAIQVVITDVIKKQCRRTQGGMEVCDLPKYGVQLLGSPEQRARTLVPRRRFVVHQKALIPNPIDIVGFADHWASLEEALRAEMELGSEAERGAELPGAMEVPNLRAIADSQPDNPVRLAWLKVREKNEARPLNTRISAAIQAERDYNKAKKIYDDIRTKTNIASTAALGTAAFTGLPGLGLAALGSTLLRGAEETPRRKLEEADVARYQAIEATKKMYNELHNRTVANRAKANTTAAQDRAMLEEDDADDDPVADAAAVAEAAAEEEEEKEYDELEDDGDEEDDVFVTPEEKVKPVSATHKSGTYKVAAGRKSRRKGKKKKKGKSRRHKRKSKNGTRRIKRHKVTRRRVFRRR